MQPSYEELAEAYRILFRAAITINDKMRREVDHVVFEGSSEDVDDLREVVNEHALDWVNFIYPD